MNAIDPKEWSRFAFDPKPSFHEKCLNAYYFQAVNNPVYKIFSESLGFFSRDEIQPQHIPLLPIRAFKYGVISVEGITHEQTFKSSGTSRMERSSHHVHSAFLYREAILREFNRHFPQEKYALICHMPGYNKNPDSSLIWMANYLISQDESGLGTFFIHDKNERADWEQRVKKSGKKPLLFGAAFGLLDLMDAKNDLFNTEIEIIETGGMKTHRREITKRELRNRLAEGFRLPQEAIHSEYGMCELLSQMYATGGDWFESPHWVQVTIRDSQNPSRICKPGEEGKIGIIDLANLYSCPFILTDDRGVMDEAGKFKVLGRWKPDSPRGCNFLIDRD